MAEEPTERAPSTRSGRRRESRPGGPRQPSGRQASGRPGCISRVAGRQHVTHLLAASGFGAPSRLPRLLAAGRVTVNGRPVRDTDARADPRRDVLAVDGEPVALTNLCRYLVVHKPYRVMCSFTDPEGRSTLAEYVPVPDVYAAGRLDYDSEGLVLLTNDGWLLHRLTHPRYEHPKTYLVQVERVPDEGALETLRRGVLVKGERTLPAEVELLRGDERPTVPAVRAHSPSRERAHRLAARDAARGAQAAGAPHDGRRRPPHAAPDPRLQRAHRPGRPGPRRLARADGRGTGGAVAGAASAAFGGLRSHAGPGSRRV